MEYLIEYILAFSVGLIVAWILVPLLKKLAPRFGLVDIPSDRRIHEKPIPHCGGVAVFIATHLSILAVYFSLKGEWFGTFALHDWGLLITGSSFLLLIGLFDDRFDMRAWFKLLGQLGVALFMFFGGFSFEACLGIPLPFFVDLGLTLFWFALLINAFNLIDGMDGACAGLGLIAGAGLAGMLISLGQSSAAMVLLGLVGACLGFLRYNFNPASIFLGDSGSMFIGFVLAAVSLKTNVKHTTIIALLVPLLAVGVPVFDVIMAVWRRVARKLVSLVRKDTRTAKVFGPDLDHIHHKLLRSGMSQRKAAIALYVAAIFACLIALGATAMSSNRTALLMIGMIVLLHVVVRQLAKIELWTTTQVVLQGVKRPRNQIGFLVAVGWDLLCLMLATLFVFQMVLNHSVTFAHLVVCILIPFLTIYFYGIYKTVWTRSRISQLLVLVLQLLAGEVLAFVALLWLTSLRHTELLVALLLHSLAVALGIVGIRASFRMVRDMGAWLRCSIAHDHENTRTLILGAGENAILYMRQATFEHQQGAPRKIVGLIDDNPALQQKVVYGYLVLGNFDDLEAIIETHNVNEVIFTHHYSNELRARILDMQETQGLLVRDFIFVLRDLNEAGACRGLVRPDSVNEIDCRSLCNRHHGMPMSTAEEAEMSADDQASVTD